ncbi:MAG: hypothetical protein AB1625_15640 [Acidobacteriota bacterium]
MELDRVLALGEGPTKTAAPAAWVQGLFPHGAVPVLVGGAAVELYTGGAYVTGDLDFVGRVPAPVARALVAVGAEAALRALRGLARRLGRRDATNEEIERWAQEGP